MRLLSVACLAIVIAGCASKNASTTDEVAIDPVLAKDLYAGEVVYIEHCASCHQLSALAKTPTVVGDKKSLLSIHPFDSLETGEIASVLTFIRNSFGNKSESITLQDVQAFRSPTATEK